MRYFASAQRGFGPLLAEEIADAGAVPTAPVSDGRSDLVAFERRGSAPRLVTADDVFAEVAHLTGGRGLTALAEELIDPRGLERALSAYASAVRPLRARETFRVITRVRSERDFLRTELREALARRLTSVRPRWRQVDPADMELWTLETDDGWRCGLRLGRRAARSDERHGALRPSVAAAMVRLAGTSGRLLDPFCGSGTILTAAVSAGWLAYGADIDASALDVARSNTHAPLVRADASTPPFTTAAFDAVVSNLPFGKQFADDGSSQRALVSLRALLTNNGRVVLLTARGTNVADTCAIDRRIDVELLGQPATLWVVRPT